MTGHVHANRMKQYAEDATETETPWLRWEFSIVPTPPEWRQCDSTPEWCPAVRYRRKPRTIRIGDQEVPEPMRERPAQLATYYIPLLCSHEGRVGICRWDDTDSAKEILRRGLCHDTPKAAACTQNR